MINKEKMVFELYKDRPIASKSFRPTIKKRFQLNDKQITNLYARINNYQLKKFGARLDKNIGEYLTEEDIERIKVNRRNIRRQKITNYTTQKQRYKEMM